ncbi:MAG: class II glutamine amidotransferase, partial [Candidatus Gastranaerophilaceae bacterium]
MIAYMVDVNFNTYQNKQFPNNNKKISFGCRVMAFIKSGQVTQEDDEFRLSSLDNDKNSLKKQGLKRLAKDGRKQSFNYEDLHGISRKYGNPDGWGIAAYTGKSSNPIKQRGISPAYVDANYIKAINNIVKSKPKVILAHIRLASPECNQIALSNVHPFSYQNWSFMHNGTVNGAFSTVIQEKINNYKTLLGDGPKGKTDSEASFYYFLGKLKESNGTTDSIQIPLEKVQTTFAESIYDLVANSKKNYKVLDGEITGIKGSLQTQPGCNFVLSDGENLLAFRKGNDLFLGEKTLSDNQKEYVVSSEKTNLNDKTVQWTEISQ